METRRLCALVILLAVLMVCVTIIVRAWLGHVPSGGVEMSCWRDGRETYCVDGP